MRLSRRSFIALATLGPATAAMNFRPRGIARAVSGTTGAAPATLAPADVAWRWFELLYDIVKAEGLNPPRASRFYGLMAVTLYEAVVHGSPSHRSLVGQLNELNFVPAPQGRAMHWPTVANAALRHGLPRLLPAISGRSRAAAEELAETLDSESQPTVPRPVFERSRVFGGSVAAAIADWSASDGVAAHRDCGYLPSDPLHEPWRWQPTPPAFGSPLEPCWGKTRPMAVNSPADFAAPGSPPFSAAPGSEFYASALEVYEVAAGLTDKQKTIAGYWNDAPGVTGTPSGHWMAIVSQIARNDRLSLASAAEAYVRAGIAVHDAFICCWHQKYADDLLRPVTYIRRYIDAAWSSYIPTPPFPTYTSGHSTQSGAAAAVLTDMFGPKNFTDTTHLDHGQAPLTAPRSFVSFAQAAEEAMISRLYGGIHFGFDNLDGLRSGAMIGQAIVSRVQFSLPHVDVTHPTA